MCCTRHVYAIDLYDLVPGLESAVLGDEAVQVDLLDHNAALERENIAINRKCLRYPEQTKLNCIFDNRQTVFLVLYIYTI